MKKIIGAITVMALMCTTTVSGQSISGVGTTAAPFLKIGVGGRALGMGEAYTTQVEDVTAIFWNPAGLALVEKYQLLFNHYDYIADLHYEFGGIAIPVPSLGTFGCFIAYLGMPDIERTTISYPEGNGELVSASSMAVGVSYARALTDRFNIGGTAKYLRENIWHNQASGLAFDVGILYRTFFKNLKIGMSITNFGGDMRMQGRDMLTQHDISDQIAGNNENINAHLDTDAFPLPILFRVGISANFAKDFFNMEKYDFIFAFDAVHPNDNDEYVNMGAELKLHGLFSMRAGHRQMFLENREGGFTFGFGLHITVKTMDLLLDYANIDYGRLENQNKFSLILSF